MRLEPDDWRQSRSVLRGGAQGDLQALPDYNLFVAKLRESNLRVATGKFGAMMQVRIENDGPVTLLLEREAS